MEPYQQLKFPYGICDFKSIIKEDYVYLDRTQYIRQIENMGKSILFLRPRRFGKSLFLDTLQNYYDIAMKDEFTHLFEKLDIGKNPTDLHNKYFVLTLDFSCIQTEGGVDKIERSLYSHINATIQAFGNKYRTLLNGTIDVKDNNSMWSFYSLLSGVLSTPYKLYVMIDEYDSFANSILVSGEKSEYQSLVGQNGLLRYIFREFKSATRGKGVDRIFATGVSPIVIEESRSKLLPSAQMRNMANDVSAKLYEKSNMAPLAQFVENNILPVFSNRDYKYANELTIKTIFLTLLHQDIFFMVASEQEHRRGYAVLAFIVRPDCRKYKLFDMVIEFKYLSLKDLGLTGVELRKKTTEDLHALPCVKEMLNDAKNQAIRYAKSIADEFQISDEQIKKWAVVGLGFERIVWEAVMSTSNG